ncbi:hypothetical protein DPMN_006534 [Dreissena polymorpha]|uniref:Uncharacterized protein n=1 Tax=Dreissena polymorpha TaxID=45954 RepID=A0A9D4MRM0_DREPO|nr:hypothetical protein DPMN_006534 [Dreissena polymorpha]
MIQGDQSKTGTIQAIAIIMKIFFGDRLVLYAMGADTAKYLSQQITRRCAADALVKV